MMERLDELSKFRAIVLERMTNALALLRYVAQTSMFQRIYVVPFKGDRDEANLRIMT